MTRVKENRKHQDASYQFTALEFTEPGAWVFLWPRSNSSLVCGRQGGKRERKKEIKKVTFSTPSSSPACLIEAVHLPLKGFLKLHTPVRRPVGRALRGQQLLRQSRTARCCPRCPALPGDQPALLRARDLCLQDTLDAKPAVQSVSRRDKRKNWTEKRKYQQ